MSGRVPLARRNLLAEPRRLAASVVGVGLAVMLILILDGLWAGIRAQAAAYANRAADVYVLQPGVRDLTAGVGTVPLSAVATVRADPDVRWAVPERTAYVILQLHSKKVATYLIGSVPGAQGGAWSIAKGRDVRTDDEIVVGTVLARRHGIKVGSRLDVMGHSMRVVGLAGTNGYMFSYTFVTHAALDALTGTSGITNMVLVGTSRPDAVAGRLRAEGLNALTRRQVAGNDVKFATGIFGSPVRLMVGIGLAAGTMIIALTAYTAIVERRREYGIVKAMGGTQRRLVGLALAQTFVLAGLGLVAGLVLFLGGKALIIDLRPQFTVLLTTGALVRATAAAAVMALFAAVVPARRLAAIEPAAAYRSAA